MEKPYLPKELSISDAITELKLDEMPHSQAVRRLLQYAKYDGLNIYIEANFIGYAHGKLTKVYYDQDGFPFTEDVGVDITQVSYLNGEVRLLQGSCVDSEKDLLDVSVYSFEQDGTSYHSIDYSGHIICPTDINEKYLYINREDLINFINQMKNGAPVVDTAQKNNQPDYLNPANENYSEELHAAIEAWLYANKNDNDKYSSFKQRVERYLKDCSFTLNPTAKNRIAIIANSNENKRNKEK